MKLIKKVIYYQQGGTVEDEDPNIIWDTVKSITPGVGTYYDIKEAINNPTVGNILGAGASLGSDLALLVPGIGWIAQANRARKAGKIASQAWKAAGQYYKWGRNATRSAQELDKAANTAKKVGNVRKYDKYRSETGRYKTAASDLNKRMKSADQEFINASKQKKAAKAAIESYKDPMLVGAAGRVADADVNAYRDLQKKQNLVEKRQNPYLYNTYTNQ